MTTATLKRGRTMDVIKNVPAAIFATCGEPYFDDPATGHLVNFVSEAKRRRVRREARNYAPS